MTEGPAMALPIPQHQARYLESPPDEAVSREESARAGLKAFFAITDEWGLNTEQQRRLLGNPGRSRFFQLKSGKRTGVSDDELDRLAYVIGIYAALNILYNPENCLRWLGNPSKADSLWRGQSPLTYMLDGGMAALVDVYRYLNGLRGGA
ncbi:MAG: DUF2384 domain-containing protein [Gammaproteobacteria bacterium]|nr:DUF2384 domain-containing protein [Gammaproteobacteria bacterium]